MASDSVRDEVDRNDGRFLRHDLDGRIGAEAAGPARAEATATASSARVTSFLNRASAAVARSASAWLPAPVRAKSAVSLASSWPCCSVSAGDGFSLRRFEEREIGERRFQELIVGHRGRLEFAGVEGVAGDSPLKDGVGGVKIGIHAGNGRRAGADGIGPQAAKGRAAAGDDVVAFDLLDPAFVLVVVHAGANARQPKRAGLRHERPATARFGPGRKPRAGFAPASGPEPWPDRAAAWGGRRRAASRWAATTTSAGRGAGCVNEAS